MTDKQKLLKYLEYKGITKNKFYLKTGFSVGFLDSGHSLGVDKLKIIIDNYHDLNLEWFFNDAAKMIKEERQPIAKKKEESEIEETRPRIPYDAAAGSLSVALDGITIENCEQIPVIKAFAKYDFTIIAKGDSMLPEFHSGDELACLYIKPVNFVQWGQFHVLDTSQGVIVKRIFDDDEYILCKSENNDLYKDFRIHKSEVFNLALVIGLVRRY